MRFRHAVWMVLATWLLACAMPSLAHAASWVEGTPTRPFSLAIPGGLIVTTDTADPSLVVPYAAATVFDGTSIEFEPRSIRLLPDGSALVACGKHGVILHVSASGRVLRQYSGADIDGLRRPFDAAPTTGGGMLIVDRAEVQGQGRVFRVDSALNVVWQFGGTGDAMGAGQVFDPFTAVQLPGGHTLIADSLGSRVIEVDDATGQIVWSYGQFRVSGTGSGHLDRPHSAQRLANGNTLICDSENDRVIEVDRSKVIVWSYGTGTAGSGAGQLANPNSANRLPNGNTLISDSDNARVIEVDRSGRVVELFGAGARTPSGGTLSDPRAALRLGDGSTLIADLGNMRLAAYRYTPHREWVAVSKPIDPAPGAHKRFSTMKVDATVPDGALLAVEYSIDGGPWADLHGPALPSDTIGVYIRYRLRLTTGAGDAAPIVKGITVTWQVAGTGAGTTSGDGDGDGNAGGSGSGSGTGSGTGTGTGTGSGSADVTATAGGVTVVSGSAAADTPLRGWVMEKVGGGSGSGSGGVGLPGDRDQSQSYAGLFVLGALFTTGLASGPVGAGASTLTNRITALFR